ncbi:hypothetical protein ACFW1M_02805 [Streptomyces inhibens]|uniref:hypothetical protein n=1 Tax=Streptomyces inhibens TaxID=2293571 RepID=UPI0036C4DD5E
MQGPGQPTTGSASSVQRGLAFFQRGGWFDVALFTAGDLPLECVDGGGAPGPASRHPLAQRVGQPLPDC